MFGKFNRSGVSNIKQMGVRMVQTYNFHEKSNNILEAKTFGSLTYFVNYPELASTLSLICSKFGMANDIRFRYRITLLSPSVTAFVTLSSMKLRI